MEVVKLLGVETRDYTDQSTGEVKTFCALHVMYETEKENMVGNAVESFSCPKDVDRALLQLGKSYELVYTHFRTKNGLGARVSDLVPVSEKK